MGSWTASGSVPVAATPPVTVATATDAAKILAKIPENTPDRTTRRRRRSRRDVGGVLLATLGAAAATAAIDEMWTAAAASEGIATASVRIAWAHEASASKPSGVAASGLSAASRSRGSTLLSISPE